MKALSKLPRNINSRIITSIAKVGAIATLFTLAFSSVVRADGIYMTNMKTSLTQSSINLLTDPSRTPGVQSGDIVEYVVQATVGNANATGGPGVYFTSYIPDGVEVLGAWFVTDATGTTVRVPGQGGQANDGWGGRGSQAPFGDPFAGVGNSRQSDLYGDTGIFYSTDSRTQLFTADSSDIVKGPIGNPNGTGGASNGYNVTDTFYGQVDAFNLWDANQVNAFGAGGTLNTVPANTFPTSIATIINSAGRGSTPFGAGSPVAGTDTGYTLDNTGAIGPWNRIQYSGSKKADISDGAATDIGAVNTATLIDASSLGRVLNDTNALPNTTNAIRWSDGLRLTNEVVYVKIRVKIGATAIASPKGTVFNLEANGSDNWGSGSRDNPWRYFGPTVAQSANLFVAKQIYRVNGFLYTGGNIPAGATVTYRVKYLNLGNLPVTGISVKDTLPAAIATTGCTVANPTLSSISNSVTVSSVTSGTATCPAASATVTFGNLPNVTGGTIPALRGGEFTYNVKISPTASGTISNNAIFAGQDIVSSAAVSKTSATSATVGAIAVGNISGSLYQDANNDNTLTAGETKLPANVDVELLDSTGTVVATAITNATGDYTFINVPVATNYQVRVVTSDPQIPTSYVISTINPITGINVTTGATVANQHFGFSAPADLSLTKIVNNTSPTVGSNVTFTLTLSNAGPSFATGVNVADLLPTGLTFVSATPSAGTTYDTNIGVWNVGTVGTAANANTATLQIVATVATVGAKTNTAQVSAVIQSDPDSTPNNNVATEDDQASVTVNSIPAFSISGTVFDDVNYGGGVGRNYTTANNSATSSGVPTGTIRRPNVRVELYNAAGNYLTFTTTDSDGAYTFNNQPANTTYTVRVVNSTVTSVRPSSGGSLIPVQIYRTDASTGSAVAVSDRVGGENPTLVDAGNGSTGTTLNTTTGVFTAGISGQAQSITQVVATTSNIAGVDFGFNFDTIVSNRDSGQGSLRQFIINSNALNNTSLAQVGLVGAREESIFMISDGAVHPGLRAGLTNQFSNGVVTITLATALPAITGANGRVTSIDGRTQTALTGDTNPPIFNVTTGPEIIIDVAAGAGLQVNAGSTFIKNIGITGANGTGTAGVGVFFNGSVTNSSLLQDTTIFNNDNSGVFLGNGATNVTVGSNIIRNNGLIDLLADGIELNNASNNKLQENLIFSNPGYGIDLHTTTNNNNRIEGNQIINNGSLDDAQDAGIGLRLGSNNIIGQNTIANNLGDGIVIVSGTGNTITENSIYNNGGLGIDLGGSTEGDGVTINDSGDGDTGANGLLNFPIIEQANLTDNSLVVTGFARAGARIEFFVKAPDPSGFGEGQTYLITYVEGSTDDSDSNTGTYTNPVNGVNQGTDTTNRFRFAIPLTSLSTTISNLDKITATATCFTVDDCTSATNGSTSEFSGSLTVTVSPILSLVKRITAINGIPLVGFDGDPDDPNGNGNTNEDENWPSPPGTYLAGKIDVVGIKPGDEVEYTIYFLNNQSPATNITICDPIPNHQTFIATGYNAASPHPTEPGALLADTGIALALDANNLPISPTFYLTNVNDSDRGSYYLPNFAVTPTTCQSNTNGAVIVNVVDSTTNLPNSSAPGKPTNSYGFIRFKTKID